MLRLLREELPVVARLLTRLSDCQPIRVNPESNCDLPSGISEFAGVSN
jgi:hypothetical protein